MTEKEHQLVVFMFAQQTTLIATLIQILEARNILTKDDVAAYYELTRVQQTPNQSIFSAVVQQYEDYAKALGLEEDLPSGNKL